MLPYTVVEIHDPPPPPYGCRALAAGSESLQLQRLSCDRLHETKGCYCSTQWASQHPSGRETSEEPVSEEEMTSCIRRT